MLVFQPSLLEQLILEVNAWLLERTPAENMHIMFGIGPTGQVWVLNRRIQGLALTVALQPVIILQIVYNGDSEEGAKKFDRFVTLGPVMNMSETIRMCSSCS